jgi:outer membrane biosynthesis protein TonB
MLPLTPPRTEYVPNGSVVVAFTVQRDGAVSDVSFAEWGIRPSDDFMRTYLVESVRKWRFPARESPCRGTQKLTFKLNEDA